MDIPQLTFTRFVAAFLILVFHFGRQLTPWNSDRLQGLVGPYNFAVTYFFVLSGFILWVVYSARPIQKKKFWIARFARIYPLYLLAWLCVGLSPIFKGRAVFDFFAGLLLLQAWIPGHALALNGPSWSLSVEAFFYLAFPFLLAGFRKLTTNQMGLATLALWFVTQCGYMQISNPAAYYFPLLHLSSFVIGMFYGRIFLQSPKAFASTAWLALAVALWCGLNTLSFSRQFGHDGLLAPAVGFFILSLASNRSAIASALSWAPLLLLGEISFGIYILQEPVRHNWFPIISKHTDWAGTHWDFYGFVAVMILVCWAAHNVIEKPARDKIRSYLSR